MKLFSRPLDYLHEIVFSRKELKRLRSALQAAKANEQATHAANQQLCRELIELERQQREKEST